MRESLRLMEKMQILTKTLGELVVGEGESVTLRGTVLGDVEVQPGGSLTHEGLITGLLYVEAGGHLYLHGRADRVEWEDAQDVEVHGVKRLPEGYPTLPFTGPEGWGAIDAVWGRSVAELDKAVEAAGLDPYLRERREDTTEDVFRVSAATAAVAGVTDAQLWALLSAAVLHPVAGARIHNADGRELSSPEDCRQRLPWGELERYFDSAPELFSRLLPHRDRSGRSVAFDCYEALSATARAMLAVDSPADEAVATIEAWRTVLREQAAAQSEGTTSTKTKAPPRDRTRSTATRSKAAASAKTRGASAASEQPTTICAQTDPVDAALCELDSLVGLDSVKEEIWRLGAFAAIERQRVFNGFPPTEITRHLVMTGNPGTGKTTVARLLGSIYVGYGLLRTGQVIEVTRSELVDKYVGKTDENVKEAFERASGGVLFIDEAYSLARREELGEPDYGRQAIDTLVPLMENRRDDVMVVAAGYPEPMRRFLRANPGLDGRFGAKIHFPDYSDEELLAILRRFCDRASFELPADAERTALRIMAQARERMGDRFHNARMVRTLFEKTVQRHHARLYAEKTRGRRPTMGDLTALSAEDLPSAEEVVPDVDVEAPAEAW